MTQEERTDVDTEEVSNSPQDDAPSVTELRETIEELKTKQTEYETRIGSLVREKGQVETDFQQWGENTQRYYQEQAELAQATIVDLESKLIERSDEDGARAVLDARGERDIATARVADERDAENKRVQQALTDAKQQVVAAFGIDIELFSSTRTPQDVWALAGQINKDERAQELREIVSELKPTITSEPETTREDEVEEQEKNSQTPDSSRGASSAASRRGASVDDTVTAKVNQLEEAIKSARKRKRLPEMMALSMQLKSLKAEHGLQ